jgi:thiol-disulfide isomerase/thioredoxin
MFAVLLGIVVTETVGCDSSSRTSPANSAAFEPPVIDAPPGFESPEPTKDEVALHVVDPSEIDAAVKKQAGKIVVIDIWATWCVPCKAEFHNLIEINRDHGKDGVVCMSVAWDQADDQDKALAFLKEKDAKFANFLIDQNSKPTKKWLDGLDVGPIPVVLVYGRDGKLVRKFDGQDVDHPFDYKEVKKLVGELRKKK